MTILLTSESSRRKALLEQVGFLESIDFVMAGLPAEFAYPDKLTLAQAREKVVEAARLQIDQAYEGRICDERGLSPELALLVGAETSWFHDGRVLPRPLAGDLHKATASEIAQAQTRARSLLLALRGEEVTVLTGLAIAQGDAPANRRVACVATRVKMKRFSDSDIEAYIATGEGLSMAGGVDLQGRGVVLTEKISGSFSNIGGLPLLELVELLRDPLFAGRVHFRLSEPDQGKYSVAVTEGPQQPKSAPLVEVDGKKNKDRPAEFIAPRLLLASQSPRRRELMKQIVDPKLIEVLVSRQAEPTLDETPDVRVKRLALAKARSVLDREGAYSPSIEIVIGADTEVVLDGRALGKPAAEEEARQLLRRLQGRSHQVITGLALINRRNGREFVDMVSTQVTFKGLSAVEIETYIESGEPFGKAGAYGIQSKGALFVEEIDGSYSNVVGLPLERLSAILDREFGLPVWQLGPVFGRGRIRL